VDMIFRKLLSCC